MEDNQQESDPSPSAPEALHIPRDLVHQIARPDDQKLRERKVGPQHSKSEQQLADVVQMRGSDDAFERAALIGKNHQERNAKRKGGKPLAGDKQQAEDGRVPM